MKLLIASDHAGFELKEALKEQLNALEWIDLGTHSSTSVDYPDISELVVEGLRAKQAELAVLICGSGIGVSIAANRHAGIRAAVVENPVAGRLAREHNHANVLCLGARFLAPAYAAEIIEAWLHAKPDTAERHARRVRKMK